MAKTQGMDISLSLTSAMGGHFLSMGPKDRVTGPDRDRGTTNHCDPNKDAKEKRKETDVIP